MRVASVCLLALGLASAQDHPGKRDFERLCSACHGADGRGERELATMADWYAALVDIFGLALDDVDRDQRTTLWTRVRAAHDRWLEARAKGA